MQPFCCGLNLADPALTDDSHHITTTLSTGLPMTTLSLHPQIGQTSRSAAKYALQSAHGSPKSTAFGCGCKPGGTGSEPAVRVSMVRTSRMISGKHRHTAAAMEEDSMHGG